MTTKRTVSRARTGYQWQNEQAAGIILQDIARYGGEGAGLVQWARLIQAKSIPTIKGPLLQAADRRRAADRSGGSRCKLLIPGHI